MDSQPPLPDVVRNEHQNGKNVEKKVFFLGYTNQLIFSLNYGILRLGSHGLQYKSSVLYGKVQGHIKRPE